MTIDEQLQKVIHEANVLREMISLFSEWNTDDIEWILHNTDQSIGWFVILQESINEKSKN